MGITKKLNREAKKLGEKKAKAEHLQRKTRFSQEISTTMAKTGEAYQRYWNNQFVIATKVKLEVNNSSTWNGKHHANVEDVIESGTVVDAIEIATFSQWLDNQHFYVLDELCSEKIVDGNIAHSLWYMMQFDNFAPNGMPRIVYLEPKQGSVIPQYVEAVV